MITTHCRTGLAAFALLLAAHTSNAAAAEPTEQEIRALTEQDIARANEPIIDYHKRLDKGPVPEGMLTQLHSVRKLGCKEMEDGKVFNCDLEMDYSAPDGRGRRTRVIPVRFSKTESGWQAVR